MRWIAVAAGVLLVASLVGSEEQAPQEESPLIYTLEVNGAPYPIKLGELVALPDGPLNVRLRVEPYRFFRAPGVEFRFPRGWQLERRERRDTSKGKWENWTIGKRRFAFDVWMRRGERDAANVIERKLAMKRRFKDEDEGFNVIRNDRVLRLAGNKVAGTTYYEGDDLGGVHTYYALRTGPDTVLFTFRELRMDGLPGKPSKEWKEMERLLQESLKVLPPMDK